MVAAIDVAARTARASPLDAENRRLFRAIGDFLAAHQLHPSPDNYALVYALVTDRSSPAAQAILAATGDGVRLTQDEADRIRRDTGAGPDDLVQAIADPEVISDARRQVEEFSTIVAATQAETRSYGIDLAQGAEELSALGPAAPQVAGIVRITGAMLERTRSAETQLRAAREEAQTLREKLAEAEEEARSDPLTRLPNRRAFEDRLAEVQAGGGAASLAICDIDRFKSVNDTHGHGVGDRVLRMVADVLSASCAGHLVARIGGEEFVVLFDGVDCSTAAAILEGARAEIAGRHFKVRGTDAPLGRITFSAGVAGCGSDPADPPLKRADALLYQAKNGGRNMVVAES
jgi:diguanylate cyclase